MASLDTRPNVHLSAETGGGRGSAPLRPTTEEEEEEEREEAPADDGGGGKGLFALGRCASMGKGGGGKGKGPSSSRFLQTYGVSQSPFPAQKGNDDR